MPHVEKNLKIQTDRRVKITDSEIARARRNEIKGFPKTSEKDSGRFEKVQLVTLSTGDAVAPWWTRGPDLPNVADVRAAEELMDRFAEAKAMSESENGKKKLVVLEFIAGWCFACRALHPKMNAICREEFADVLFLRVRKDECPSLCDAMGVENVPFVQLYTTVSGAGEDSAGPANTSAADVPAVQMVDAFSVNLTAPKLAQLRSALRRHKATDNHRETTPTTARWGAFGVPSKPS
jgi:thiol-disulfide isomerase/thioredoxin